MANNIFQAKRTSTAGRTPNTTGSYATNSQYIAAGEFALNMADQILYTSDGTNLIAVGANNANVRVTNGLVLDNDKRIYFRTKNTAANVMMVQQIDDNFVFYSTNTSYLPRPVWSIYANSDTSNIAFSVPAVFNTNVYLGVVVANGSAGSTNQVLTSNGSTVYWSSPGVASVNVAAQYTWTNLHTFQANVSISANALGLTTNTSAIYFAGTGDVNWKMGRNTAAFTKWRYTNNSVDVAVANSNLEGFTIGNSINPGNSFFETGFLGTFIASNVTIGSSTSNSTINSTAFSGTANNSTYFNGYTWSAPAVLGGTTANGAVFTYANVTGQVNTATLYVTTSANVGTAFVANSIGVTTTGFVNAATVVNSAAHTVGTAFVANSTQLTLGSNVDFIGDFSSAAVTNRSNFQTSTLNGSTGIYALPNGTSGASSWQAANSSDPTNASKILIATNGSTDVQLVSGINGTGTYLPLSFYTNGAQQMQLDTAGKLTVGNSTVNAYVNSIAMGAVVGFQNYNTLTFNYTTPANYNTVIPGPYTVNTGVTLTITSGTRIVIV